ncbi:unnamed protein product [Effrenium voratum]|nr:unnamed protein product [Effrenium voratum]
MRQMPRPNAVTGSGFCRRGAGELERPARPSTCSQGAAGAAARADRPRAAAAEKRGGGSAPLPQWRRGAALPLAPRGARQRGRSRAGCFGGTSGRLLGARGLGVQRALRCLGRPGTAASRGPAAAIPRAAAAQEALRRPATGELANAAWACAKGNPSSGAPCLQHIASASLQSGRLCTGFTAIDVAQLSWSLATVQLREAPAMAACAAFAAAESESFGAQGLANCAWAMAGSWPAAVAALLDEASARLGGGQFTSQHVANLAWAAAVTKLRHEFFASPDLKLPGSPRHLANLGWALGTLQLRSPLLYQLSEQAVGMGLHSFRDEELAGDGYAFCMLSPRLASRRRGSCAPQRRRFCSARWAVQSWRVPAGP